MKKIKFSFGIHCHQPVGNFDFVFEEAYRKAYQPFLEVVEKFPDFKINIHYSGILLDWIEKHFPEHIALLGKLVSRGQAEIMGGGFYEPILSAIPARDAVGQIKMLSGWIQRKLGTRPRGMWLAERVWEPVVPTTMKKSNMEYTVIDDSHFKYSGLKNEDLLGYYITEDVGNAARIFPISQKLRYTIPFQAPEVTLEYLREIASEEERLIVFADDGEKFGVWPGMHEFVFEKGWLENFIRLICDNLDWIRIVHFSEAVDTIRPLGRIYLPTASYAEMMHWALYPKAYREYEDFENYLKHQKLFEKYGIYIRGGFWRNFLAKYSESNQMHKKMLYVSELAWKAKEETGAPGTTRALQHVWASQCNCPYWHGVFGGLYLGHLRHAVYREMLKAENLLRKKDDPGKIVQVDYNEDGFDDLIFETPQLNLYLEPAFGGRITEIDFLPREFNILNTMSRREEGYHRQLREAAEKKTGARNPGDNDSVASIHDIVVSKEEGLEKFLNYDFYERRTLIDHFLGADTTIENFQTAKYRELGDFYNSSYRLVKKRKNKNSLFVEMERRGTIENNGKRIPVLLNKKLKVKTGSPEITIRYQVSTSHPHPIEVWFAVEFNFGLLAGYADDRYYFSNDCEITPPNLASSGESEAIGHLGLVDEYSNIQIDLESDKPALVWRFPIETISHSEAGFERVYQNSVVLFSYKTELNKTLEVKFQKKIGAKL